MSDATNNLNNLIRHGCLGISTAILKQISDGAIMRGLRFHFECDLGSDEIPIPGHNRDSLNRHRVLTPWFDPEGCNFWIITEADRSKTTVFFPWEFENV